MWEEITKGAIIGWIVGPILALTLALFGIGHVLHLGHHGHSLVRTPNCVVMVDGDDQITQCGRGNTVITTSGNDATSGIDQGNTSDAYVGD